MRGRRGSDRWVIAVVAAALGLAAAWLAALTLVLLLAPINVDQPITVADLGDWAWRWGWLLAVLLAAAASLGPAPVAAPSLVARQAGWALVVLVALASVAGLLAVVAVRLHLWGRDWGLPSRSGYGARLAAVGAAEVLGLPLAWLLALRLWRRRQPKP